MAAKSVSARIDLPPDSRCRFCNLDVALHTGRHGERLSCQQTADFLRYATLANPHLREVMLRTVEN